MRWINSIFTTSAYNNLLDKQRAGMIYTVSSTLLVLLTVFIVFTPLTGRAPWEEIAMGGGLVAIFLALGYIGMLGAIVLTRSGRVDLAAPIAVVITAGVAGIFFIGTGGYSITDGIVLMLVLAFASLVIPQYGLFAGIVITLSMLLLALNQRSSVPQTPNNTGYDLFVTLILLGMTSGLLYAFLRFARLNRLEGESGARQDRLRLAEITSQITQRISRRQPLAQVLGNTAEQIRENYPSIYHAQIFLLDESGRNARLAASTGDVGRLLMEKKHNLPVGSQSVIGQVTLKGQAVVARAGNNESVHRRNEFLPDTAVEAAFPLRIGDLVIGALDLQSKLPDAFSPDDTPIFQSLADHLAIAIDNARLFEETERQLAENRQLIDQTQKTAEEVARLNQRLTGRFWADYLRQQTVTTGLNLDLTQQVSTPDDTLTPTSQQAIQQNQSIQGQQNGVSVVAVPLRVRGQVIGAMEFELDSAGNISPEDVAMLEEVSEQLGLAAETNRLFETSQRIAQREALVNEIATRLETGTSVEMTLTSAAQSLKEALQANRVAIRLGKPVTVQGGQS
ncbi:MAG: GAF domain-containing protein [Anaerolineae bacterium]|nr:GAF domain-containing protein [Anaerolineae bacterium]